MLFRSQMMKASLALAERRPDDLKEAMEKLGQDAPSNRQLLMLRLMGLVAPPASAGIVARVRGGAMLGEGFDGIEERIGPLVEIGRSTLAERSV